MVWVAWSNLEDHVQSFPMRDTPLLTELLESSFYVNVTMLMVSDIYYKKIVMCSTQ